MFGQGAYFRTSLPKRYMNDFLTSLILFFELTSPPLIGYMRIGLLKTRGIAAELGDCRLLSFHHRLSSKLLKRIPSLVRFLFVLIWPMAFSGGPGFAAAGIT